MRSEAFPRCARLSGQEAFSSLLRSRRSARGERFLVQAASNGRPSARLGIVVGRRVARRAVDRNFLKRFVRETFRRQQDKVAGFDLLVRPRRKLSADELITACEELRTLLLAAIK